MFSRWWEPQQQQQPSESAEKRRLNESISFHRFQWTNRVEHLIIVSVSNNIITTMTTYTMKIHSSRGRHFLINTSDSISGRLINTFIVWSARTMVHTGNCIYYTICILYVNDFGVWWMMLFCVLIVPGVTTLFFYV